MAFRIYTKTGDSGETSLFGGKRLPKHHLRIETYGTVDELNSHLGLVRDLFPHDEWTPFLKTIQDQLFAVGSLLASDPEKEMSGLPNLQNEVVLELEKAIDRMDAALPALKNFILPGGHPTVSHTHICRCVCRRAERLATALSENEKVDPLILQYLNRLSDFLFMLARIISKELGAAEVPWNPRS